MPRDYKVYVDDILEAIAKIKRFTAGFNSKTFSDDEKTFDAVIRNLEVIGEAVKKFLKKSEVSIRAWNGRRSPV